MTIPVLFKNLKKFAPNLIPDYYQRPGREVDPNTIVQIPDAYNLSKNLAIKLKEAALEDVKNKVPNGTMTLLTAIRRVVFYHEQPDAGERTVSTLQELALGIKDAVNATSPERHWLYREMGDGTMCPVYVAAIEFIPFRRYRPAYVDMKTIYIQRGKMTAMNVTFHVSDITTLRGAEVEALENETSWAVNSETEPENEDGEETKPKKKTKAKVKRKISEILLNKKLFMESAEAFNSYKASIPGYSALAGQIGKVIRASGKGFYMEAWKGWSDKVEYIVAIKEIDEDNISTDLVLDDTNKEKIPFKSSFSFWRIGRGDDDDEEMSVEIEKFWDTKSYSLPFHPYILAYDLRKHTHVWIHSDKVINREYEKDILSKLVLPERDKGFLEMLMGNTGAKMQDIIQGKSSGVFILSEGVPGTGKTLTAEIHAEAMQRPLYKVQCAQLGVKPDEIEERLQKVLERAVRWGAILLLDEGDVYIRARGLDVQHNAIVGTMLRVIEYYSGLLFITTNISNTDDAIVSRATAHIIYKNPGEKLLVDIWKILSKQARLELAEADCRKLAAYWPGAVGRDVKNLVALALIWREAKKQKITANTIIEIGAYQDMEGKNKP